MPETALTDTAAAATDTTSMPAPDSVAAIVRQPVPKLPWSATCPEASAPSAPSDSIFRIEIATDWLAGMASTQRPVRPGYDSGVLTMLLCSFLIVAMGFHRGARLWKSLIHDLTDIRRRSNAFDDRTTGETWVISAMILQSCIYTGLMIYALLGIQGEQQTGKPVFASVAAMTGIAIGLYLFRLCGYWVTGYAFTDHMGRLQWIRGFNASQIMLGCLLTLPSLIAIFYPDAAPAMLIIASVSYIAAESVFICKGFRIFYHHFESLLYFILYLCALEIIPVILAFYGAVSLYRLIT